MVQYNNSSFKYLNNTSKSINKASEVVTTIIISLFSSRISYVYSNSKKLVDFHGFNIPLNFTDLLVLGAVVLTLIVYIFFALKNVWYIFKINKQLYRSNLIKEIVALSKKSNKNCINDVELSLLKYSKDLDIIETRNSAKKIVEITILPKNRTAFWFKIKSFEVDIFFDPKSSYYANTYRERGIKQ